MATDAEIYKVYNSTDLWASIFVENLKMANVILNENLGVPNHDNRLLWAKYILANPEAAATRMRIMVISNGDIQNGDFSDTTIGWVVGYFTDVMANFL